MNHKFTADGRKVAIIGSLNSKETIVQEIFVQDGAELPAGEHFVVKTLLDTPAETYGAAQNRKILEDIERHKKERDKLAAELADLRFKMAITTDKIKWIEGIEESEVKEVFENLRAILRGEYTHVIITAYDGLRIEEWTEKSLAAEDSFGRPRKKMRLISLFGEWNGRLELGWRINTYKDGSGQDTHFIPCRSLQDAVKKAGEIISAKQTLSDVDYQFCLKYGINLDESKNATRIQRKREQKEKEILETKERLRKQEAELEAIGGNPMQKIEDGKES